MAINTHEDPRTLPRIAYETFLSSRPRACNLIFNLYDLDKNDVWSKVLRDAESWEHFKLCAKYAECYLYFASDDVRNALFTPGNQNSPVKDDLKNKLYQVIKRHRTCPKMVFILKTYFYLHKKRYLKAYARLYYKYAT